jgi:hypothetical protein
MLPQDCLKSRKATYVRRKSGGCALPRKIACIGQVLLKALKVLNVLNGDTPQAFDV